MTTPSSSRLVQVALLLGIAGMCLVGPRASAALLPANLLGQLLAIPNAGLSEPQKTPSAPVGTLPGTFEVGDQGAARISIPIDLPPAAGPMPALSFEYDSQAGDGPLGMGWRLGGLSAISRCGKTLARDGEVGPVRLDDSDPLCLDGRRLVLTEGTAHEVGATYRLLRDDFTRVRVIGSDVEHGCTGGHGFEARRKDGSIAVYGCTPDATVEHPLGPASWALATERDRFGNYTTYHYQADTIDGAEVDHRLSAITYGAHADLHASTRSVRLQWGPRPDASQGWRLGAPIQQTRRLEALTTVASGGVVHRYELDYATPSITGRSLLQSLRKCDAAGVCVPATTFEWSLGELDFEDIDVGSNTDSWVFPAMFDGGHPQLSDPVSALGQTVLDANGDGHTDILAAVGVGNEPPPEDFGWELWTSQPGAVALGGNFTTIPCRSNDPNYEQCVANGYYAVEEVERSGILAAPTPDDVVGMHSLPLFAGDLDGDGRDDVLAIGAGLYDFGGIAPAGLRVYLFQHGADGFEQTDLDPGTGRIWAYSGADMTGDGLADLMLCTGDPVNADEIETGTWHFIPNQPDAGLLAENIVDTGLRCSAYDRLLSLDHDGDGLASLLTIPAWDDEFGDWSPVEDWPDYQAIRVDPFGREDTGLPPDLLQRWRPGSLANAAKIESGVPFVGQNFGLDKVLDANGDGLPDILRYELDQGDSLEQLADIQGLLHYPPATIEHGGVRLWLNTGAGFVQGPWVVPPDEAGPLPFNRFRAAGLVDFNADGKLDYLTPVPGPDGLWDWSVFVGQPDGTFLEHPINVQAQFIEIAQGVRSMGAFDLRGDGLQDIGVFSFGTYWDLLEHAGDVPDKLIAMTDGLGARTEVDYRSLVDHDAPAGYYDLQLDSCAYPQRCERNPRIVVEEHRLDSGITGEPRRFTHRYGTERTDREGRRGLGFAFHERIEWSNGEPITRRRVDFDHSYDPELGDFPFVSRPRKTLVDQRDPATGRHRVTADGTSFTAVQTTDAGTYFVYPGQHVASVYERSCVEDFCDLAEFDESSRLSRVTTSIQELDDFGNVTRTTESVDPHTEGENVFTYSRHTVYQNDPESWLLGLPTSMRMLYAQPGKGSSQRESVAGYDGQTGAMLTLIREPYDAELILQTEFGYDAHGNRTSTKSTDFGGTVREHAVTYDEHGVFPTSSTNALGHTSKLRWDPGLGLPIEATDPNGLRLIADYDGLGHATGLRAFSGNFPRGDATGFEYVALDPDPVDPDAPVFELRSTTAGHGHTVEQFDRLARPVVSSALAMDGVERRTETRYDARGRVAMVSLPAVEGLTPPGWESYAYDFADRLITHTLADGTQESWTHAGLEVVHTDLGGTPERQRYDAAWRLVESVRAEGSPDEERLCFDYGLFEQLEVVRPDCVDPVGGGLDYDAGQAPPTTKTFTHDRLGRLIATHDPSEGPRTFELNGHGELTQFIDGKGQLSTFVRDTLGRVTGRVDADGLTSWAYDTQQLGALDHSVSADGHETAYGYDSFGRVTELEQTIYGESFAFTYGYDGFNRLGSVLYPGSDFWVEYVYVESGDLHEVRSGADQALLWRAEQIDEAGRLTLESFGNATTTARTYDPLRGHLERIDTEGSLGGTLQALDYTWNPDGTLYQRADELHAQSETFAYDDLHRVIEASVSNGQTVHARSFAYDALGNLVYATDRGGYDYDANGRLSLADGLTHDWDANGNLTQRGDATLSYTAFDKPRTISAPDAEIELEYDADGQRAYRYDDLSQRETLYVGGLYERHYDDSTGETQHHYQVMGGERVVATVIDHTVPGLSAERSAHYVHVDHLGSASVISDEVGLEEQRLAFDIWGKRRDAADWTLPDDFTGLDVVNLGYTGHHSQLDAGLVHMRGRLYDPHLGRMTSADPFVVDPLSTQGWNRYAYVLNQPGNFVDPSGYEPDSDTEGGEGDGGDDNGGIVMTGPNEGVLTVTAERTPQTGVTGSGSATDGLDTGGGGFGNIGSMPAAQRPGDIGPSTNQQGLDDATAQALASAHRIGKSMAQHKDPTLAMTDAMVRVENPSQERRRHAHSDAAEARAVELMQNPPTYVVVSIEVTMIFIGGDAELVAGAVQGIRGAAGRRVVKELGEAGGETIAAGAIEGGTSGQSYRILDGVRRSKATQMAAEGGIGNGKITAEVIENGKVTATIEVEAGSLFSPKRSIDTNGRNFDRWRNTLRQTFGGSKPPTITVEPGATGTTIKNIPIE